MYPKHDIRTDPRNNNTNQRRKHQNMSRSSTLQILKVITKKYQKRHNTSIQGIMAFRNDSTINIKPQKKTSQMRSSLDT